MRYNTLKELSDVINILWEINDVARSNCGEEGYQAIQDAITSVQNAWNVCKKGMENKGMDTSVYSSRKAIKSSDANHTYEEYKGNFFDLEKHLKWFDDNKVNREIAGYFGKENVKKFYDLTAGADVSTDGYCIKLIYPNGEEFDVKSNNGMYELWYIGEDRVMHNLASISHYAPERFLKVLERALPYTQERRDAEDPVQSARRTIKSGKKYNVIDKNGGVVGQPKSYEDACDEAEEIGGTVKPVESSRKSVKSGLDFVQKGEVILAKKGTKVVGYIGQNADKEFYYGLGTPGKSSGVMVVSDFNSAAKRLEEQIRQ